MGRTGLSAFLALLIISTVCGQYFSSHDFSSLNRVGRSSLIIDHLRSKSQVQRPERTSETYLNNVLFHDDGKSETVAKLPRRISKAQLGSNDNLSRAEKEDILTQLLTLAYLLR